MTNTTSNTLRHLALAIVAAALLSGCGPSEEEQRAELSRLCTQSSQLTAETARNGNSDAMMTSIQTTLQACGGACDLGDQGSCQELDHHVGILCDNFTEVCNNLCNLPEDDSIKRAACAAQASTAS